MKTPIFATATVIAALLAAGAAAGDPPRGDASRNEMRADKDGDGRVSRAEATAAAAERSNEWFDRLDLNKDGYVTQEETQQARENRRGEMRARMDEHFKAADINTDGAVDASDLSLLLSLWGPCANALDCFADIDGNGAVDMSDLVAMLEAWRRE